MAGSGAGNVGCIELVETVETQNVIIRLQASVISELFCLLSQHITADELDSLPVIEQVNMAAELRKDVCDLQYDN